MPIGFAPVFVATMFTLLFSAALDAHQEPAPSRRSVDAIFSNLTDVNSPGVAVLIRKNHQTLFNKGYGVTDPRTKTPITSQTNFRLASCTKQFTAMAIMLLVHDGKLRYDEALTEILPKFPDYGRHITIRNLLNHTSGLPDYESLMNPAVYGSDSASPPTSQISDAEVLALLESQTVGSFVPGTKWAYSNSGYVVLGVVVARISGQPFEDFLRTRIFEPLQMTHTVAYVKGKNAVADRAYGHSKEAAILKETDQSSTSATLGDGGIYSNLEDLAKWDDALTSHQLLSAAEMQPALTPGVLQEAALSPGSTAGTEPQSPSPASYGFGWFLELNGPHPHMWHYGETIGFKSAILRFTQDDLTIIILANRTDLDPSALAKEIARVNR